MEILASSLPARSALDRARRSRDPRFDGRFFVGRHLHRRLLPAGVPGALPPRRARAVLPDRGGGGRRRLPAVPALPSRGRARDPGLARHLGPGEACARARSRRRPRRGVGRRARRPARHRAAPPAPSLRGPRRRAARSRWRRRAASTSRSGSSTRPTSP